MPSTKILEQKKAVVEQLAEELRGAQTIVLADYRGLTVEQDTELRSAMRKNQVVYKVVKNRMMKLAVDKAGLEDFKPLLTGPTVMAYSTEDMVTPAKLVKEFSGKYPALEIKGGSMDGKILDLDGVNRLAAIPALNVLHGKLVSSLISPIAGLAMILGAICEKGETAGAQNVSELVVADADAAEPEQQEPEVQETATESTDTGAEAAADDAGATE